MAEPSNSSEGGGSAVVPCDTKFVKFRVEREGQLGTLPYKDRTKNLDIIKAIIEKLTTIIDTKGGETPAISLDNVTKYLKPKFESEADFTKWITFLKIITKDGVSYIKKASIDAILTDSAIWTCIKGARVKWRDIECNGFDFKYALTNDLPKQRVKKCRTAGCQKCAMILSSESNLYGCGRPVLYSGCFVNEPVLCQVLNTISPTEVEVIYKKVTIISKYWIPMDPRKELEEGDCVEVFDSKPIVSFTDEIWEQYKIEYLNYINADKIILPPTFPIDESALEAEFPVVKFIKGGDFKIIMESGGHAFVKETHPSLEEEKQPRVSTFKELILKLFFLQNADYFSFSSALTLMCDLYKDVVYKDVVYKDVVDKDYEIVKLVKTAISLMASRMDPTTHGVSQKKSQKEGVSELLSANKFVIQMTWTKGEDLDIHVINNIRQEIYFDNKSLGGIKLEYDHQVPGTEVVSIDPDYQGRFVIIVNTFEGPYVDGVKLKITQGRKSIYMTVNLKTKDAQSALCIFPTKKGDVPTIKYGSMDYCRELANKILINGGGNVFPYPIEPDEAQLKFLSEKEEINRQFLVAKHGLTGATAEVIEYPKETLIWRKGVGATSAKCPTKLQGLTSIHVDISDPSIQPCYYICIMDGHNIIGYQCIQRTPLGRCIDPKIRRSQPKRGELQGTSSGKTFGDEFGHLKLSREFVEYIDIQQIYLDEKGNLVFYVGDGNGLDTTSIKETLGNEVTVSPSVINSLKYAPKKDINAINAHPVHLEFPSTGRLPVYFVIQEGWYVELKNPDNDSTIDLQITIPKPEIPHWTEEKPEDYPKMIENLSVFISRVKKLFKMSLDIRAIKFFEKLSDPTYQQMINKMKDIFRNAKTLVAHNRPIETHTEMTNYCDSILIGKWSNIEEVFDPSNDFDAKMINAITVLSSMPLTADRVKYFKRVMHYLLKAKLDAIKAEKTEAETARVTESMVEIQRNQGGAAVATGITISVSSNSFQNEVNARIAEEVETKIQQQVEEGIISEEEARQQREEHQSDDMCSICLSEPKTHGCLHGDTIHKFACSGCITRFNTGENCPICREPIERIVQTFQ